MKYTTLYIKSSVFQQKYRNNPFKKNIRTCLSIKKNKYYN